VIAFLRYKNPRQNIGGDFLESLVKKQIDINRSDRMDRRTFLHYAGAVTTIAGCHNLIAQTLPNSSVQLSLSERKSTLKIPLTYTGLSYELAQLTDPYFFSASNHDLVAYFRLLSPHGVLRIGGNSSEFCWFKANASTPEPKLHLPTNNLDANWMPHELFAIMPAAIDSLADFIKVTGWHLIYGINFGNNSPEKAAVEAAYVAQKMGDQLEFFQIGNEPDFYHDPNNGTRPRSWGFSDYMKEWTAYAEAIIEKVPKARFGGPDVGASSEWVTRFDQEVSTRLGSRVLAVTGHYYAQGPPNDPHVTIKRLLNGDPYITNRVKSIVASARSHGRIYRMTEGNSCYRGGKPGMSNAFASSLWVADYMLHLADLGCAGVNLHGGSSNFLIASLGGHTPGVEGATHPQAVRGGFYTPISSEPSKEIKAMPIFYGMMLANQFAGCTLLDVNGNMQSLNATAYAVKHEHGFKIAFFNKDELNAIDLSIQVPRSAKNIIVWRMKAPALDSTEEVSFGGAEILAHAKWKPKTNETVKIKNGISTIQVPAASAILLFLNN
jgi:hypothetical protein